MNRVHTVRRPVAAGTFYPQDEEELAMTVDRLLEGVTTGAGPAARAVVVPHAGYVYSGPVAATAFSALELKGVRRVALLGPAHFVPLHGIAVPRAEVWSTPLGQVQVDAELREAAARAGAVVDDLPHAPEHSLEVQVPFLQRLLEPGFTVVPVAVGAAAPARVVELIGALWSEPATAVIVSTDLSHYHDDATARRLDRRTADAVLALDASTIGPKDACGSQALRGIVGFARAHDLDVRLLDLRTSADTAGDPEQVVGYGAFAFGRV